MSAYDRKLKSMSKIDYENLKSRLYEIQNGTCFICSRKMDLKLHILEIDHIIPRAKGGKDEENNMALVHRECNRRKLDSDLRIARCMSIYSDIKTKYSNEGPNRPNLGDFLTEFDGAKYDTRVNVDYDVNSVKYSFPEISNEIFESQLFLDKLSKMYYFFADIPVAYLHHDDRINPRAVSDRIKKLIQEFIIQRPQLHIGLAWALVDNNATKIQMFDGQHKAVSQILLGVKTIPVRTFINPEMEILLEANTNAGTTLRQVAFDKSVQRLLGSKIFWEKVDEYRKLRNLEEEYLSFSESDLLEFFKGQKRELRRYILDNVRAGVINDPNNQLKDYIQFAGRAREKPLSYSTIEKTFYSFFIYKKPLTYPMDYKLEIGENPRQLEKTQLVELMNIIAQEIYEEKYDMDIGTNRVENKLRKGDYIPDEHLIGCRMAREEIIYNWLKYIQAHIRRYFLVQGEMIEEDLLFQNTFPQLLWDQIRNMVVNLSNLPIWKNRDEGISASIFGGKQTYDYWNQIMKIGIAPGNIRVLAKGLNLDELIR